MILSNNTVVRLGACLALLILLAACAGTEPRNLTLRTGYQAFSVESDLERKVTQDWDPEWDFACAGIELAVEVNPGVLWFMDVSDVSIDGEDSAEPGIAYDADGYGVGFGLRSPGLVDEGWGCDWRVRLGYHRMDDAELIDTGGVPNSMEWEYEGFEMDASIGASCAFPAGDDLLFVPHGGVLVKAMDGQRDEHRNDEQLPTPYSFHGSAEYEVLTLGIYAGFRLKHRDLDDFDASAGYFIGLEELQGFYLSLGMRF